jgi:hypothetical protein
MNKPTCETCPFWSQHGYDDASLGQCRRFPPLLASTPSLEELNGVFPKCGFWPETGKEAWCGEHPQFQAWLSADLVQRTTGSTETAVGRTSRLRTEDAS